MSRREEIYVRVIRRRESAVQGDRDMGRFSRILLVFIAGITADISFAQTASPPGGNSPSVVLITGSNRGIGLALATAYAQAGWEVIATCRDPARATGLDELARS